MLHERFERDRLPTRAQPLPHTAQRRIATYDDDYVRFIGNNSPAARARTLENIKAGRAPDIHRLAPVAVEDAWEATAVDITRLDKNDPAEKRRINNAWRRFKEDAPAEAADLAAFFPRLRAAFPDAGIEVPAETLQDEDRTL